METLLSKLTSAGTVSSSEAQRVVLADDSTLHELEAAERSLLCSSTPDLQRFFDARDGDVDKAFAMASANISWRASTRPLMIASDAVPSIASGWWRFAGYSRTGMPVLSIQTKHLQLGDFGGDIAAYARFVAYFTEVNVGRMVPGQTKAVILFDMSGYKPSQATPFALRAVKKLISLLGDQHPERLGYGIVVSAPAVFHLIYKAVKRNLDPVTQKKIVFAKTSHDLARIIPSSLLSEGYGGTHAEYPSPTGGVRDEIAAQRATLAALLAGGGDGGSLPLDALDMLSRLYRAAGVSSKSAEEIASLYARHGGSAAKVASLIAALRKKYGDAEVDAATAASNAALCAALRGEAGAARARAATDDAAVEALAANDDELVEEDGGASAAAVEAAFDHDE